MSIDIPFKRDYLMVVVLRDPKEKYWGSLLGLEPAGIAQRGIELSQWEQILSLIRGGEALQVALATRFFPMHRVELMYADEEGSGAESLGATFFRRTGIAPLDFLGDAQASSMRV